jgi:N-acetylneuraminic acid mutarotase
MRNGTSIILILLIFVLISTTLWSDEWEIIPQGIPTRYAPAVATVNNVPYLFGGTYQFQLPLPLNDLWKFDASTKTWQQVMPVNSPPARYYAKAAASGGKISYFLVGMPREL